MERQRWRQLGGWAIGSRGSAILRTRLELTALFAISILVILTIFTVALNVSRERIIRENLGGLAEDRRIEDLAVLKTAQDLREYGYWVHAIVTILAISGGFYLSKFALGPIVRSMEVQRRFVADASHELRTPLSIMKANAEVALMDPSKSDVGQLIDALNSNVEEVDRMSRIIKNLFSLSMADGRTGEMPFTRIDLSALVDGTAAALNAIALNKNIKLSVIRSEPAKIWGNETALEELATNLIKNAIDYTDEGGAVDVSVHKKNGDTIQFTVKDSGVGIDPEEIPHIFNPFYKTKIATHHSKKHGFGLGLAIVKEIVNRHKGTISVRSEVGKGTLMTVNFLNWPMA
ncbi:MAG: HAMP domain-containing sensor histidine kinase [bacterium]|nr:HAMP domain-containing sensor histidine kinase [bacterium]